MSGNKERQAHRNFMLNRKRLPEALHMAAMGGGASEGGVAVWEWRNEFDRWRPYEPAVSRFIEQQYTSSNASPGFLNLGLSDPSLQMYRVDLNKMEQTRYDTGRNDLISVNLCITVGWF